MSKYEFKYRLSQKSSFAQIVKAARALDYKIHINKGGILFLDHNNESFPPYNLTVEDIPEWLNEQLEEHELLAPKDLEL